MVSSFPMARLGFREIVVDDLPEREREICDEVYGRDYFQHRQFGDGGKRMRPEVQGCRPGPGAPQMDVL